jgi:hypothetical protein
MRLSIIQHEGGFTVKRKHIVIGAVAVFVILAAIGGASTSGTVAADPVTTPAPVAASTPSASDAEYAERIGAFWAESTSDLAKIKAAAADGDAATMIDTAKAARGTANGLYNWLKDRPVPPCFPSDTKTYLINALVKYDAMMDAVESMDADALATTAADFKSAGDLVTSALAAATCTK